MLRAQAAVRIRSRSHGRFRVALAAVVAAGAAWSAAAAVPPTGLAPGKAKGTITVNGKAVTLAHAYAALEPNLRHRLLDAIGTTIDDYGGSFIMNFETVLIAATRLG